MRRAISTDSRLLELRPASIAIVASAVAINPDGVRPLSADRSPKSISHPRPPPNLYMYELDLALQFELAPVPQAIELNAPQASSDPQHSKMLCELERHLRNVVRNRLTSLVGRDWVRQRVPLDVRKRCQERQDENRADGRPVYDLIEYADFMDLPKIIVQSDNWRDVFEEIFRIASEVDVSFQRLNPIRKALAHSRPLSQEDVLTLAAEATRILGRLRIRVLH